MPDAPDTPDAHDTSRSPALIAALCARSPLLWLNPAYDPASAATDGGPDVARARARLERCAGLMAEVFPELRAMQGRLTSPLVPVPGLQRAMWQAAQAGSEATAAGTWLLKRDDALPVAGSIKARGGFHEVLALAESLALQAGLLAPDGDRMALCSARARELFAAHTVAVGSTGNLGLSIGLIAAALGFKAVVHMSVEAKDWKKRRLRDAGIEVVEHAGDYAEAVAAGRRQAEGDPRSYFVDDEHSEHLFLGYAAAAGELAGQMQALQRPVDAQHPLFVYLPCGVGGAPGGIAYGLKQVFGPHVHCFFAEPCASPCMLVQLACGTSQPVSVYDIGLDNRTEADGLAVGQASPLVAPLMAQRLAGVFTVDDDSLLRDVYVLHRTEGVSVEPSAAAGLRGPLFLTGSPAGRAFLDRHGLAACMDGATHVLWSTGGSLVPAEELAAFRDKGRTLVGGASVHNRGAAGQPSADVRP